MIRSMTGFGRAQVHHRLGTLSVEIRCLNHRYFEMSQRLPPVLGLFEDEIRTLIHERIKRGRMNLSVSMERVGGLGHRVHIEKTLAKRYCALLKGLQRELHLQEPISLSQILALPDVITVRVEPEDPYQLWPVVSRVIDQALRAVITMKEREGRHLAQDLTQRIRQLQRSLEQIRRRSPAVVQRYRRQLLTKLKRFSGLKATNRERIESEIALFAQNADVSEEITRTRGHLEGFYKALRQQDEVGRRLDFIAQELFREINTIGAKANDLQIEREVIEMKTELERIREQVQNVE